MAKKQLLNYKFVPGPITPAYDEFPDAVALLVANRTFLVEEVSAYITAQVAANIGDSGSPYYGYTYDSTKITKCKRDIGYVIDAVIYDLKHGGNILTWQIASRFYVSGTLQLLNPLIEVDVKTWLRGIITTKILTNTSYTALSSATQTTLSNNGEADAISKTTTLINNIISVIQSGLGSLPTIVVPSSQNGGLIPNTVELINANKRFIQEETIAYIQYNVTNNIEPFVYYTYNSEKCKRDISYILEGYITDLKHGGNRQTVNNVSKYFENGIPQVDGDRTPEIAAHSFIKSLITGYVLANIEYTAKQTIVSQIIDNGVTPETYGISAISALCEITVDVITNGLSVLPTAISNRGYVKFPGYYKLKDILLVTNTTRNQIIYNFADETTSGDLTYSENYDSDFPAALYGQEKITTLTFDADTTGMMVTDQIQIFVEGKEQIVKLNNAASDAMERMKVGIPQSMLDADFEYGLQPTKWQAIAMMRNYPAVFEYPGSDIAVTSVVTDASSGTSGAGSSLITVTTVNAHGLTVGTVITIKALANSITGFARAEGSFIVNSVPTTSTFTYYAKSKVGSTDGQQLSSTYTQLRKAGYYTGAGISNPAFSVYSTGSSGTITTSLISRAGVDFIGFTGTVPPVGSPISGTGIVSGTQITAVTGSGGTAASTTLATNAASGDTTITVSSTTGITPGLVFDRGDGKAVVVTQVSGNDVSLSGALTSTITGNSQTYSGLSQTSTSGSGSGASVNVSRTGGTYSVEIASGGNGYSASDTLTIAGTSLGGTAPTNTATITVSSASNKNTVATFNAGSLSAGSGYSNGTYPTSGGTGTGLSVSATTSGGLVTAVSVSSAGAGYTVGDTITLTHTLGVVLSIAYSPGVGTNYTSASNVAVSGGTGTGMTVDIVAGVGGIISSLSINNPGSGYTASDSITIIGSKSDGHGISALTTPNSQGTGYLAFTGYNGTGGTGSGFQILVQAVGASGEITSYVIQSAGSGYTVGDTISISGGNNDAYYTVSSIIDYDGTFSVSSVSTAATIDVATVNAGGVIQTATIAGTPITAPTKNFISAFTINTPTTSELASGDTGISYSAIATIEVSFPSPHGLVPGNTITVSISSSGSNAQLAAGAYYVEQVPTTTSIRYTARAAGAIANTLTGTIYARPDSYFVHRPFDGGVQLGTGGPAHGATAIRMSKKYIRYQSGKGVMYNTGALFAPSYDIRSMTSTGTTPGSVITLTTDDTDHGCQVGAQISISGVATSGYNGIYTVVDIIDERTLSILATQTLGSTSASLNSPCVMSIRHWHGATVRSGIFDDQNGMFYQYDGIRLSVVRRSSTFQIAGTISVNTNSNSVSGSNTRFSQQLAAGDRIVIRGMSHVVTRVISDTSISIAPDFRGVTNVSNVKICKTVDLVIPQENFNLDPVDGSGPSGYNLDITKMQMIGIQHTWYGAGFIDFMLRGPTGEYIWLHRFRNSNVNTEAYMRTGNQPVRYEVINEGAKTTLSSTIDDSVTTIPLTDAFYFPTAGTVLIDAELIRYTGNTGSSLTGCVRGSSLTQFAGGAQRTFTAGVAASHSAGTGVILVSNTITPIISHWGSAFMIDGQFDSDRGYIFNYASTGISVSVDKQTAFLIRLAPSVSNAQTGDLGEKELLNRAQLLLSSISIVSDSVSGGGGIVIEGVLNPSNYPDDPTKITWTGLSSQAAGGQPSFAQIAAGGSVTWSGNVSTSTATIQGAFTTTLTAKSFAPATQSLTAISFSATNRTLSAASFGTNQTLTAISFVNGGSPGGGNTYFYAVNSGSPYFLITNTQYNALAPALQTSDPISSVYFTAGTTISAITYNWNSSGYTRIQCSSNATSTSTGTNSGATLSITATTTDNTTYRRALSTSRTDFLVAQSTVDTLKTTTPLAVGDGLSVATYVTGGQTISSITENYITIASTSYARIVMSAVANANSSIATSNNGSNISVVAASSVAARYNTAISAARTDFLITQAQYAASTVVNTDVLSATTYLTGGQSISAVTANYTTIAGTAYARVVMSSAGTSTSTAGSGNNITVTSTSASTAAYGSALSSARTDFLITDAAYASSGIAVGDVLNLSTYITGSQTISSISTGYITISSTSYTRIVMSAAANATSTSGSGNDQTVTVTASGTASSYTKTSYLYFTSASWEATGALIGTRISSDVTSFPAGTSVNAITTRTFGATTVYRVSFTQASNTTLNAAGTVKFAFGAQYALPGEQVFSFIANPGGADNLSLESLKELTATAIGGRGAFPNGPDVLAINVYKVAGTATTANLILRWGEAQA